MIPRKKYLEKLRQWKDEDVIKVVTGVRRCGKSTLLNMFRDVLIKEYKVSDDCIISINFEDLQYDDITDYKKLYDHIYPKLKKDTMTYVFLDEVQKVDEFQKVVDSLHILENTDIYIAGSNAYILSGELATLLSGRYVEINMLPMSFSEYISLKEGDPDVLFTEYMKTGGLPYAVRLSDSEEKLRDYLDGIYNTIIIKDIEERQRRKEKDSNKRKISDINLLKNIARFLADSIGNQVSVKSVANYITSSGKKVSENTISDYINALTEPYIFYPVEKFDISGKQLLKNSKKYYIVDPGLRRNILQKSGYDLGFLIENIVFLELVRRGYKVNIGRMKTFEVDFVANKDDILTYFQVTASLLEEETFNREIRPLKNISDNFEKIIITLDRFSQGVFDGIKVINLIDWLLEEHL